MRNIKYYLSIAFLIIAALMYLNRGRRAAGGGGPDLLPEKISSIDGLLIVNGQDSMYYSKNDTGSWLNDEGIPVNADIILGALGNIEIVSPASRSAGEYIARKIRNDGTVIKITAGKKVKSEFRMLYDTTIIPGTYLMSGRNNSIYLIRLKGYSVNNAEKIISSLDRLIQGSRFPDLAPDEIREIRMEYPDKSGESFRLINKDGNYELYIDDSAVKQDMLDKQRISDYLTFFRNISTEYPSENENSDIPGEFHFVTMDVLTASGQTIEVDGYRRQAVNDNRDRFDMTVFTGIIDRSDTVIFKYSDMDPVFSKAGDFLKK